MTKKKHEKKIQNTYYKNTWYYSNCSLVDYMILNLQKNINKIIKSL